MKPFLTNLQTSFKTNTATKTPATKTKEKEATNEDNQTTTSKTLVKKSGTPQNKHPMSLSGNLGLLPKELFHEILVLLDLPSLNQFMRASKSYYTAITADNVLWKTWRQTVFNNVKDVPVPKTFKSSISTLFSNTNNSAYLSEYAAFKTTWKKFDFSDSNNPVPTYIISDDTLKLRADLINELIDQFQISSGVVKKFFNDNPSFAASLNRSELELFFKTASTPAEPILHYILCVEEHWSRLIADWGFKDKDSGFNCLSNIRDGSLFDHLLKISTPRYQQTFNNYLRILNNINHSAVATLSDEAISKFAKEASNSTIAAEHHQRFWKSQESDSIWSSLTMHHERRTPAFYLNVFTETLAFNNGQATLALFDNYTFFENLSSAPGFVACAASLNNPIIISTILEKIGNSPIGSQLVAAISTALYSQLSTSALEVMTSFDNISQHHPLIIDQIFTREESEITSYIKFLFDQDMTGIIIDILNRKNFPLNTPVAPEQETTFMHLLVKELSYQSIETLLEKGCIDPSSFNVINKKGLPAIYDCFINQEISEEVIKKILLLIKHGADIHIKTDEYNSIFDCILERKLVYPSKTKEYDNLIKLINELVKAPTNNNSNEIIDVNELKDSYRQLKNDNDHLKGQMQNLTDMLGSLVKASEFQGCVLQQLADAQQTIQAQQQIIQAQQQIIQAQQELIQTQKQNDKTHETPQWAPGFHTPTNQKG